MGAPPGWTDPERDDLVCEPSLKGLRVVGMFAGVGLLDLGLHRAADALGVGVRHLALVERDPWRRDLLWRRFPGSAVLGDARVADVRESLRGIVGDAGGLDLLVAGPPCAPHSRALVPNAARTRGVGAGHPDFLLDVIAEVVRELRPAVVVFENVEGLVRGHQVEHAVALVRSLSETGYEVGWRRVTASSLGAPHRRGRWFAAARLHATHISPSAVEPSPRCWPDSPPVGDGCLSAADRRRVAGLGDGVVVPVAAAVLRGVLSCVPLP